MLLFYKELFFNQQYGLSVGKISNNIASNVALWNIPYDIIRMTQVY